MSGQHVFTLTHVWSSVGHHSRQKTTQSREHESKAHRRTNHRLATDEPRPNAIVTLGRTAVVPTSYPSPEAAGLNNGRHADSHHCCLLAAITHAVSKIALLMVFTFALAFASWIATLPRQDTASVTS